MLHQSLPVLTERPQSLVQPSTSRPPTSKSWGGLNLARLFSGRKLSAAGPESVADPADG